MTDSTQLGDLIFIKPLENESVQNWARRYMANRKFFRGRKPSFDDIKYLETHGIYSSFQYGHNSSFEHYSVELKHSINWKVNDVLTQLHIHDDDWLIVENAKILFTHKNDALMFKLAWDHDVAVRDQPLIK